MKKVQLPSEKIKNATTTYFLNKYKVFPSMEAARKASEDEPVKTFKKMFGIFKKEKCIERGVTIGGKHIDEYMPQFMGFFKENLL